MPETMFSKVWDLIMSRFPDSYPHQKPPNRQTAEEVYGVLCSISPSLAKNIPIVASWVVKISREGPGVWTDLQQIKTFAQIELFLRSCELISVMIDKEKADLEELTTLNDELAALNRSTDESGSDS